MNESEKRFLYLVLFLLLVGVVARSGVLNSFSYLTPITLSLDNEFVTVEEPTLAFSADSTLNIKDSQELNSEAKKSRSKKPAKKAPTFPLNVNTASEEDLCFIKGIGPSLAKKIIEHRERKGAFKTPKDLEKVNGIGAKKRKSIEEFVVFE